MAIFKNRQTEEKREINLDLVQLAKIHGTPVPFAQIDLQAVLGLQGDPAAEVRRLKDSKVVVEGPRWDLYLNETESSQVYLAEEAEALLKQTEEAALKALSCLDVEVSMSVKDTTATGLQGYPLFVLMLLASSSIRIESIPQKTGLSASVVLNVLGMLDEENWIRIGQ